MAVVVLLQLLDLGERLPELAPPLRVRFGAGQSDVQQLKHLPLAALRPPHVGIEHAARLLLLYHRVDPASQVGADAALLQVVGRELTGENLQNEDAEAPDVRLLGGLAASGAFGRLEGHHDLGGVRLVHDRDERVVGEDGIEGVGEEHVGRLEMAVGDGQHGQLLVKVGQRAAHSLDDLQSARPVQWRNTRSLAP